MRSWRRPVELRNLRLYGWSSVVGGSASRAMMGPRASLSRYLNYGHPDLSPPTSRPTSCLSPPTWPAIVETLKPWPASGSVLTRPRRGRPSCGTELTRQGRELTAALLRTAIAETEARTLREALAEARWPAWRRWLGL